MDSKLQTLPLPSDKEVSDPVNENKIAKDEEMDWFYAKLDTCSAQSSVLSITPPFSQQFKPKLCESENICLVSGLYGQSL